MFKKMINTTFGKVTLIAVLFVACISAAFVFYIIPRINQSLMTEKQYVLHELSTFLLSTLTDLNNRVLSGELSEDEAKNLAFGIVSNYRYGKNGDDYFWVNDKTSGTIFIHPYDMVRGTNLRDLTDENGYNFGAEMLNMANRGEEGYVRYMWLPKPGGSSDNAVPKLSHVSVFEPWGWVIGTGIYIDDVQKEITSILARIIIALTFVFLLLIGLLFLIISIGSKIERQKNLILSEFASLIQHLPIGMFRIRIDKSAPPLLWNDALLDLLNIPDASYMKRADINLMDFLKNPDDKKRLNELLLKKGEIKGEELELYTYDHQILWIKIYGKTIRDKDLIYFDASVENITEKRKIQEVMQKSYAELKKVDRMKNEIISITSHELRTPLTIIKGFASMLANNMFGPINETQKTYTEKIISNSDKLLEMITNMLDLEKLESGKMQFDMENVNLSDLISRTYSDFRMRCADENKQITFHPSDPDIIIKTDHTQLRRIIINLIDNAIKFVPPNVGCVDIFTKRTDSDTIEVHVKDNGIGIAPGDIGDIFKKFKQVGGHMTRVSGGSGLGLPIAKKLITQLGGTITVESTPGIGSDFYITLPIKK